MEAVPPVPDFTLLRRIGAGSYGDVWLGRSVTGVWRAVKVIRRSRFEDDRPFWRELEGITRFQQSVGDQPRQLALLHVGRNEPAGLFYYVMELADDATGAAEIDPATYIPLTLQELRRRRQWLPAADCVRLGSELATALDDLHQAGLLHRDVKPSNVILVGGRAKLADVGLIASSDAALTAIGTPAYAAPEGTGSVRADLFSLGRILYELATGLRPDDFPRLPPDVAQRPDAAAFMELNEIVLRACHADAAQRYPDAEALLADLRLVQAGRSVQELNRTRRQLRQLSRFGALAAAAALAVIAVLGARNYFALRALATQETAFRRSAEAGEQLARYTSDLHFAQLALSGGDLGGARNALRRQRPAGGQKDLRGIEWYALWNQSAGQAARTFGAAGGPPVTALAPAADGRSAVIIERGTPNRAVWLDLETGARRVIAPDCYGLAAYDSRSSRLVVTTRDLSVHLIAAATGARRPQPVRGILLDRSPDGRTVLLSRPPPADNELFAWDASTGAERFDWNLGAAYPQSILSRATATGDLRLVAASLTWNEANRNDGYEVVIRRIGDGAEVARVAGLPWTGGLRFSPDGRRLAIATATDVRLVDVDRPSVVRKLEAGSGQDALEFSPDGSRLAVGGEDGVLTIWSVPAGARVAALRGHESGILALRWLPDGAALLTGGMDGTCRLWRLDGEANRSVIGGLWAKEFGSVVLNSTGSRLAVTGGAGSVVLMDTASLAPRRVLPDVFCPLAYADGDRSLLSVSAQSQLTWTEIDRDASRPVGPEMRDASRITAFGVSATKRFAVFGTDSGEIRVWNLAVRGAAERLIRMAPGRAVIAAAVSDDGELVAASDWERHLGVYEARTGAVVASPANGLLVTSLCFSPDGARLAIGTDQGRLIVWDRLANRTLVQLQSHSSAIRSLLFAPDQTRLLSGGADGLVVVWMTDPWRWIAAWSLDLPGPNSQHSIYRLDMDQTGSWLVALTDQGQLQRWDCRADARPAAPPTARDAR